MIGPFPSGQDVWYCDHKQCQYTQYGVFRKYKIERWRSSKFGKKFTLCDGCVRQFLRPNPNQQMQKQPSNVNVKININGAYPMQQPGAMQPMQQPQQQPQQQYYGMQNQAISPPQAYTQPIQYQQPYIPMEQLQQQAHPLNKYNNLAQQLQTQPSQPAPPQNIKKESGNDIVKQGYMMKKGDLIKNWKKRYFVLKSNKILNYYESDNAVMVKGSCSLKKVNNVKKKSGQSFEIDTPKRKWCFACKDEKVRDAWVQAIQHVMEK